MQGSQDNLPLLEGGARVKKVNSPDSSKSTAAWGAAPKSRISKSDCRNLPRKTQQYSFKKVPHAPPPTWAYRVSPSPKAPNSQVSLGKG